MARTVYKLGVTKTAATLAEHGAGITTGHIRTENGRDYVLVKATAVALADGILCAPETGQTTTAASDLVVKIGTATTDLIICCNNTGAVVPASHYFWGIQRGRGYVLGGAAIGDGVEIIQHTTDGTGGPIATGATDSHLGFAISDVTTTVANAVFWSLPSKRAGA